MHASTKATLAFAFTLFALAACSKEEPKPNPKEPVAELPANHALAKRGGELVRLGGCSDCHTPLKLDPVLGAPMPDMSRFLSGHPEGMPAPQTTLDPKTGEAIAGPTMTAWKLPFGTVYTANLTPDVETGLGAWTEAQFITAVRTGKHMGAASGRPILAPMPWMNLAGLPEADLKAIFAYLRTLTPVKNHVPEPEVAAPVFAAMSEVNEKIALRAKPPAKL